MISLKTWIAPSTVSLFGLEDVNVLDVMAVGIGGFFRLNGE